MTTTGMAVAISTFCAKLPKCGLIFAHDPERAWHVAIRSPGQGRAEEGGRCGSRA